MRLETWDWLWSPAGKHTKGGRPGLLWLHDLRSASRVSAIRAEARVFVDWADSRFPLHYAQSLLTAAAIDPDLLGRFLKRVSRALLAIAPPFSQAQHAKEMKRAYGRKPYEMEISTLLNGLMNLEPMLSSGDDDDLFFDSDTDETAGDPFSQSYIRYAAPETGKRIEAAIKHLRSSGKKMPPAKKRGGAERLAYQKVGPGELGSRRAWQAALEEAMRLAATDFDDFIAKEKFNVLDSRTPGQRAFVGACKRVKQMARARLSFSPGQWWAAARQLQDATEAWEASDMSRHVTRETKASKQIQLTRRVGFVVQYAALMRGNGRLRSMAAQIMYLRDICDQIVTILDRAMPEAEKPGQNRSERIQTLAACDRLVLAAGAEARLRNTFGEHAGSVGRFVERVVTPTRFGGGQTVAWAKGECTDMFLAAWPEARKLTRGSVDDLMVNKCLGPLQRFGLAAQVPEKLWSRAAQLEDAQRDGEHPAAGKPLASHVAKKWVVCPLAAVLAGQDVGWGA